LVGFGDGDGDMYCFMFITFFHIGSKKLIIAFEAVLINTNESSKRSIIILSNPLNIWTRICYGALFENGYSFHFHINKYFTFTKLLDPIAKKYVEVYNALHIQTLETDNFEKKVIVNNRDLGHMMRKQITVKLFSIYVKDRNGFYAIETILINPIYLIFALEYVMARIMHKNRMRISSFHYAIEMYTDNMLWQE
ncbi:hypothetical protein ACJX0J_005706, partial [Zea mays]